MKENTKLINGMRSLSTRSTEQRGSVQVKALLVVVIFITISKVREKIISIMSAVQSTHSRKRKHQQEIINDILELNMNSKITN